MTRYGVIFDMDGVLVDSAEPHFESWRQLAREAGGDMTREQFWQVFGRQNRDIIPLVLGINDPARIEELGERKEVIYREIIGRHVPAVDGAVELVRSLHDAGCALAIGSSGPPENVDLVLEGMGIAECFKARITSQQVTRGKPDPQVFTLAAEALGIPTNRCAVVEDAPAGVQAARRAGAVAIALAGGHPAESLSDAERVVHSLRELTPSATCELIDGHAEN